MRRLKNRSLFINSFIFFLHCMKHFLIIVLIVILAVAGYYYYFNKGDGEVQVPQPSAESQEPRNITIALGTLNNSGQSGTAILTEDGTKTKVLLVTNGGMAGNTPQPAHIHIGSCPTPGAVKYPLTAVVNGSSETSVDVALDKILTELPLAINVHKSAQEVKISTVCGDLVK